jgi:hypothetical protein
MFLLNMPKSGDPELQRLGVLHMQSLGWRISGKETPLAK